MTSVNYISIHDLIGLTIKSLDDKAGAKISLQAAIDDISAQVAAGVTVDKLNELLDNLAKDGILTETVNATRHLLFDFNNGTSSVSVPAVNMFCNTISAFIKGSKQVVGNNPDTSEGPAGASGKKMNRKPTSDEQSAWDIINQG